MNEELFLATTALEDFWDTTMPILFLGEWCRIPGRRHIWEPLDAKVLDSPWGDPVQATNAYRRAMDAYEQLLPILSAELNRFHGVEHSTRYWRITVGPWLMHYSHALYDRYTLLQQVIESGKKFKTTGLSKNCFVTPRDTLHFISLAGTDRYNLQLFTRILSHLGRPCECKEFLESAASAPAKKRASVKSLIIDLLERKRKIAGDIVLYKPYFSTRNGFLISIGTFLRARTINRKYGVNAFSADDQARREFSLPSGTNDRFLAMLLRMLPQDLPACYIEGYSSLRRDPGSQKPPKAIFAANSWYYDEYFKQWAAHCVENGTKLFGIQHGGNYGSIKHLYAFDHELSIVDRFYTWGWNGTTDRIVPFCAPKLIRSARSFRRKERPSRILFATNIFPRYLNSFSYIPSVFAEYLEWQYRFYSALEDKGALRLRPHREDLGWEIVKRWKERAPDLEIEEWNTSFIESLRDCRLYVCDHLSTTFLEALSSNKPTILFWDPRFNELFEEALPHYASLRAAGILHDTPESAAQTVNRVYREVDSWWMEPARQAVVQAFCSHFAKKSASALKEWIAEFNRIRKECDAG